MNCPFTNDLNETAALMGRVVIPVHQIDLAEIPPPSVYL
jgi:hypothetical protein